MGLQDLLLMSLKKRGINPYEVTAPDWMKAFKQPTTKLEEDPVVSALLVEEKIKRAVAFEVGRKLKVNFNKTKFDVEDLRQGMEVELEHKDVTGGDLKKTAMIALVHLKENPDYYKLLKRYVEKKG